MPKPNRAVESALKRVDKREAKAAKAKYSPNSKFPRTDQRRITANLDADNSHKIMNILTKLNDELDTSFVFATHDEKIMGYLKRIIRLEDGNIVDDKNMTKGNL